MTKHLKSELPQELFELRKKVLSESCTLERFVKLLKNCQIEMTVSEFIKWLDKNKYIDKSQTIKKQIRKKSLTNNLIEHNELRSIREMGKTITYYQLMITTKGQYHFLNKLIKLETNCK